MNKRSDVVMQNPVAVGLQLGAAGAAAGLGYAAIHRAIRLHRGDEEPVHVVRPMLVGALIGTVLGGGLAVKKWNDTTPMRSKYAALCSAIEKKAIFDSYSDWNEEHPLMSTAGYFTPGVGAVMSAADAANNFSHGQWVRGLGNALMIPVSAVGAGGIVKALPRIAKAIRGSKAIGRMAHGAEAAKVAPGGWFSRLWHRGVGTALGPQLERADMGKLTSWARKADKFDKNLGADTRMFANNPWGKKWLNPTVPTAAMLAGTPMTMFGSSGSSPESSPSTYGSAETSPYTRYRGLSYMSNLSPDKLPFNGAVQSGASPFEGYTTNG